MSPHMSSRQRRSVNSNDSSKRKQQSDRKYSIHHRMPVYHPFSKLGNHTRRSDLVPASLCTMHHLPWLLARVITMASHGALLEGQADTHKVEIQVVDITQIVVVKVVVMAAVHIPSKDVDLLMVGAVCPVPVVLEVVVAVGME